MRKLLSLLLIFSVLALYVVSVYAEEAAETPEPEKHICGDYEYIILEDGTAEITLYSGEDTELVIPSELDGIPLTSIGDTSFPWCNSLTSVTIPDGVINIGVNPFIGCENLNNIVVSIYHPYLATIDGVLFSKPDKRLVCYPCAIQAESYAIPQGIRIIGDGAFWCCSSLSSITIPDSVISIGSAAFYCCYFLTSITIPEGVTSIGDGAFYQCDSLTSIAIPDSVNSIDDNPFAYCRSLMEILVSADNSYFATINGALFSKTDKRLICCPCAINAESFVVPQGVQIMGIDSFSGCDSLTSITIPDSITSIEDWTFSDCSALTSIMIPDSVTSIGDSAFSGCGSLASITIPESVISIGERAFYRCSALTSITIPDGVTSIEDETFLECTSLTSIKIPDGVTSIGSRAFSNCCSLTSIVIPENVSSIGVGAFSGCDSLTATVPHNSYAKQYCEENGIKYIHPDTFDWLNN